MSSMVNTEAILRVNDYALKRNIWQQFKSCTYLHFITTEKDLGHDSV